MEEYNRPTRKMKTAFQPVRYLRITQGAMVAIHTNDLIHNTKECEFIENPDFYL